MTLGKESETKMRTLRIAAVITIIGGLVASVRFAQALAIEMAFAGPPDLNHTVPLFLVFALIPIVLFLCGVAFLMTPTRRCALRASRGCTFSLWILLANLGLGAGLSILPICLIYFFILKPAIIATFGSAPEPKQITSDKPELRSSGAD